MPDIPPSAPEARWFTRPLFRWSLAILGAMLLGVLIFEALGISVFSRIGMPHEFCYLRDPKLVWLHVVSDLLIGGSYVSISTTLAYLVYRASKGIPFNWVSSPSGCSSSRAASPTSWRCGSSGNPCIGFLAT